MKVLVFSSFRLWRVIVAALVNFTLGYAWYGPLFGGVIGGSGSPGEMGLIMVQFVLGVMFTFGVAWILSRSNDRGSIVKSLILLILLVILPANAGSVTMLTRLLVDVGFYAIGAILITIVLVVGNGAAKANK
jgi:hypothetical protein